MEIRRKSDMHFITYSKGTDNRKGHLKICEKRGLTFIDFKSKCDPNVIPLLKLLHDISKILFINSSIRVVIKFTNMHDF